MFCTCRFPPAEWDVLTTTIDAQIADEDKQHPARWLRQVSQHYLGEEPIIQSTHNFVRILRQEPGMSIQDWHTLVRLEYQKCNFHAAVDDRLQRDIFVIGLNETFKSFRSDIIARENLATLTFTQVISKARDFEAGLKTESAITKHHLEEAAHKVSPAAERQPITLIDVSRIDPQALQVARHALGVGVPPTLIAGTALLPTTLVMAVGNGVIGSKFAAPHLFMSSQKLRPALKQISKTS